MSAYSGVSKRIKNALVLLATAITYDSGSGGGIAFQQVLDSNSQAFDSWPNLAILPGELVVTHETAFEADKVPSYILRVRIPLEDTAQAQSVTYDKMYDLTDLLIDALNVADQNHSLADASGIIAITMMDISRGDWMEVPSDQGLVLLCDVNVAVTYSQALR